MATTSVALVIKSSVAQQTWLAMHWHRWRTRHQARARHSHYRARTTRAHSP
jgi:hypothetical protein